MVSDIPVDGRTQNKVAIIFHFVVKRLGDATMITSRRGSQGPYITGNGSDNGPRYRFVHIVATLLLGIAIGRWSGNVNCSSNKGPAASSPNNANGLRNPSNDGHPLQSSVQKLKDLPFRKTSHVDITSQTPILKQQFIEPFVVPNLAGISVATLTHNQTVTLHHHNTMHEFFYVLEGTAIFGLFDDTKGRTTNVGTPGTLVHAAPHTDHEIRVDPDSPTDLKLLVIGITIDGD